MIIKDVWVFQNNREEDIEKQAEKKNPTGMTVGEENFLS